MGCVKNRAKIKRYVSDLSVGPSYPVWLVIPGLSSDTGLSGNPLYTLIPFAVVIPGSVETWNSRKLEHCWNKSPTKRERKDTLYERKRMETRSMPKGFGKNRAKPGGICEVFLQARSMPKRFRFSRFARLSRLSVRYRLRAVAALRRGAPRSNPPFPEILTEIIQVNYNTEINSGKL